MERLLLTVPFLATEILCDISDGTHTHTHSLILTVVIVLKTIFRRLQIFVNNIDQSQISPVTDIMLSIPFIENIIVDNTESVWAA